MLAKYVYVAGATVANVVADLVALAGGAALASLSAACDKAASSLTGSASLWAPVEAAYGVVSSPLQGGGNKLARLKVSGANVVLSALESWNAGTHVATNETTVRTCATVDAAGGTIFLYGSADVLAVAPGIGGAVWALVAELNRESELLKGGRVPVALFGGDNSATLVRFKNPLAAGDLTNYTAYFYAPQGANVSPDALDVSGARYVPILPAFCITGAGASFVGSVRGVYRLSDSTGATTDLVTDAAALSYALLRGASNACYGVALP